jgi:ribonuclease P/MRP protein subunit RPP20
MGAAIPHLTLLATSLPSVLPFSPAEICTEVLTGTVHVQDELIPDDEDEDIGYRTRGKSTLSIVLTIGDGVDERPAGGGKWGQRGKRRTHNSDAQSAPAPAAKPAKATPMVLG